MKWKDVEKRIKISPRSVSVIKKKLENHLQSDTKKEYWKNDKSTNPWPTHPNGLETRIWAATQGLRTTFRNQHGFKEDHSSMLLTNVIKQMLEVFDKKVPPERIVMVAINIIEAFYEVSIHVLSKKDLRDTHNKVLLYPGWPVSFYWRILSRRLLVDASLNED
ncbi:uncharacterized protein LOC143022054 isoform X1 [Oratosquilla oratoria]|uniref:uncharacterized protein LOC143022054 isoform X1 n=2 Tax=Oratosquilla oratoria TaxID=337810 RepID=UPI003F775089